MEWFIYHVTGLDKDRYIVAHSFEAAVNKLKQLYGAKTTLPKGFSMVCINLDTHTDVVGK